MSVSALTSAFYHSESKYTTRLVLLAIANFDNPLGSFPSLDTIGRLSGGVNRRTVQRAIDELVELGELTEVTRNGTTNLYRLTISCPENCDGSTSHKPINEGGGLQTTGGPQTTGGGGLQTTGGAVSRPPKLKDNPKENPIETKLSEEWYPSERLLEMFKTKWPLLNAELQIENFRLFYIEKGTKHKNWDLTFQRWMNQNQEKAERYKPKGKEGGATFWDSIE